MVGNKPIKSFKAGAVYASIFENESNFNGNVSKSYKVVVKKMYKDKSGNWSSTYSFSGFTELPKVMLVLNKCYEYLAMFVNKDSNPNNATEINMGNSLQEEYSY